MPAQAATGSITGIAGKCVDNQKWNAPGSGGGGGGGFVVSESQFNSLFPGRNGFYTYSGLVSAMSACPAFATTGSDTVKKQEAAAFLANVAHETGNLVYVTEIDKSGNHCDASQSYGCPAGTFAYYGRGPIQLSWNFNYQAAGDALGINLLGNPHLVEQDSAISWKTGLWYWMTQTGPGSMTGHNAMVNGAGFGRTIRSINGSLECDGRNPAQVQSRVDNYNRIADDPAQAEPLAITSVGFWGMTRPGSKEIANRARPRAEAGTSTTMGRR
ncbi:LOW QUALITY PROTEIN: chitinase, partial [Kutzneria sp. 744]